MGETHVVAAQTAARCDELFKGTHRGALGVKGLEFVALREQKLKLEVRVRGIGLGVAGSKGCAVLGQGQRSAGEGDKKVVLTQGLDERAFIAFEAHRNGASFEPLSSGTGPLLIDAHEGGKLFFR